MTAAIERPTESFIKNAADRGRQKCPDRHRHRSGTSSHNPFTPTAIGPAARSCCSTPALAPTARRAWGKLADNMKAAGLDPATVSMS